LTPTTPDASQGRAPRTQIEDLELTHEAELDDQAADGAAGGLAVFALGYSGTPATRYANTSTGGPGLGPLGGDTDYGKD
jgi:hypothetical protein